jgi:DNA-binding response OmpR family regulator
MVDRLRKMQTEIVEGMLVGLATQCEECLRPGPWHTRSSKTTPAQTSRATPTVLIVEDNPRLRRMMSEHVARMGLRVLAVSHYAAALSHIESGTLDVACIDIGLPTESGYELCEYIRGPLGLKFLPIVVTSEFGSPEYVAYAEKAGANAFLLKPFSMPELSANIAALLGERGRTPRTCSNEQRESAMTGSTTKARPTPDRSESSSPIRTVARS